MVVVPHEALNKIAEYLGAESWAFHVHGGGLSGLDNSFDRLKCWLVVPDVSSDFNAVRFSEQNPDLHLRSLACITIRQDEEKLGVLALYNLKSDGNSFGFCFRIRLISEGAADIRNELDTGYDYLIDKLGAQR